MLKAGDLRGHVFDPDQVDELPSFVQRMGLDQRVDWCSEQTLRYRIVEKCAVCDRDLTATEVQPHTLKHAMNGRVRAAAGTVLALSPAEINEVLALVNELKGGS